MTYEYEHGSVKVETKSSNDETSDITINFKEGTTRKQHVDDVIHLYNEITTELIEMNGVIKALISVLNKFGIEHKSLVDTTGVEEVAE